MMCFKAKIMSETCTLLRIYFYPRKTMAIFMILCYKETLQSITSIGPKRHTNPLRISLRQQLNVDTASF